MSKRRQRERPSVLSSVLLSMAIASATLLAADYWFDTLSGQATQAARSVRGPKSEQLAAKLAALIERGDEQKLKALMVSTMDGDAEIVSIGVRQASGTLVAQTATHARHWRAPVGRLSTTTHVQVPVYAGSDVWGHVEISYREAPPPGVDQWVRQPQIAALWAALALSLVLWLVFRRRG